MLVKENGEIVNIMGSHSLLTIRCLGEIDRVICTSSCQSCNFYSSNPGCRIAEIIDEARITRSGQFYE